jgi:hypothetical protein
MRRDDHVNNCTWYLGSLQGFWERKGNILKKTNRERILRGDIAGALFVSANLTGRYFAIGLVTVCDQ